MNHEDAKTICNMCGNTLLMDMNTNGLVNAKVSGGYDSKYLSDMTSYTFSFCEKCLAEILLKCKIEPYTSEYGIGYGSMINNFEQNEYGSFKKEQEYLKHRRWYNEGYPNKNSDVYQHFLKGKCTFKYKCKNKAKYLVTDKNSCSEPFSYVIYKTCCERHSKEVSERHIMIPYMSETNQLKMILLK